MKNTKNRTLALILALSLIISAACVIPYFADGIGGNGNVTANATY